MAALAFVAAFSGSIGPVSALAKASGPALTLHGDGSIDEAWLTGAHPGDRITLLRLGRPVATEANPGIADSLGSLIVRNLRPGRAYSWRDDSSGRRTPAFAVLAPGQDPRTDAALYARPTHARRAQLHRDAGWHHPCSDRSLPLWPELFGEQSVSHGHRVLRLQRRRPDRPHPAADRRRVGGTLQFLRKPEPSS